MSTSEDRKGGYVTAYPMLFLGLGGTGVDVLIRLRFWMTFGRSKQIRWPIYDFLIIDTDAKLKTPSKAPTMQVLMQDFGFEEEDKFNIGLDATMVDSVLRYAPNRPGWSRIDVAGALRRLGSLIDGAGQTRAAGTAAFIYYGKSIIDRLKDKLTAINSDETRAELLKEGVQVVAPTHVHVVLSVAGGTGSGGLTEILGMLDYLKQDFPALRVHLYIFLADLFDDLLSRQQKERAYANTYAALQELEFLAQGGEIVEYVWDDLSGTPPITHKALTPLFNSAYLFSRITHQGSGEGGKGTVMDLDDAAETLTAYFYNLISSPSTPVADKLSQIINAEANIGNYEIQIPGNQRLQLPAACRYTSLGVSRIKSDIPAKAQKEVLKAIKEHLSLRVFGDHNMTGIASYVSSFEWERWIEELFKYDSYVSLAYDLAGDVNYRNPRGWVGNTQRKIRDGIRDAFNEKVRKILNEIEEKVRSSIKDIAGRGLKPLETFYREVIKRLQDEALISKTVPRVPNTQELVFQRLPRYIEEAEKLDPVTTAVWGNPLTAIASRLKKALIELEISDFLNREAMQIWRRSISYLVEEYEGEIEKIDKLITYFNELLEELDKKADAIYETFMSLETPFEYVVEQDIRSWQNVKDDINKELRVLTDEGGTLNPYNLYMTGEGKVKRTIMRVRDRLIPLALSNITSYLKVEDEKDCRRVKNAYDGVTVFANFRGNIETHRYVIIPRASDSLSCSVSEEWEKLINSEENFYMFVMKHIKDFQFLQNLSSLPKFRRAYESQISTFNATVFRSLLGRKMPPLDIPENWFDLIDVASKLIIVTLAGGLADYECSCIKVHQRGGLGTRPPIRFESFWDAVLTVSERWEWKEALGAAANSIVRRVLEPSDSDKVRVAALRFIAALKLFYKAVYGDISQRYGVDIAGIIDGKPSSYSEVIDVPLSQIAYFALLGYAVKDLENKIGNRINEIVDIINRAESIKRKKEALKEKGKENDTEYKILDAQYKDLEEKYVKYQKNTDIYKMYEGIINSDISRIEADFGRFLRKARDIILPNDIRFYYLDEKDRDALLGGPLSF